MEAKRVRGQPHSRGACDTKAMDQRVQAAVLGRTIWHLPQHDIGSVRKTPKCFDQGRRRHDRSVEDDDHISGL